MERVETCKVGARAPAIGEDNLIKMRSRVSDFGAEKQECVRENDMNKIEKERTSETFGRSSHLYAHANETFTRYIP